MKENKFRLSLNSLGLELAMQTKIVDIFDSTFLSNVKS